MEPDYYQRRRVMIAIVVTMLVVPAFLFLGRDKNPQDLITTDSNGAIVSTPNETTPGVNDPMGTLPTGFLTDGPTGNDGVVPKIVIPRPAEVLQTTASFRREIRNAKNCYVPTAPLNSRLNITNIDNGRIVACVNSLSATEFGNPSDPFQAILAMDAFTTIADVTDAPVPIEVTW